MNNFLETLQRSIEIHLNSHKSFQSIPVFHHDQSNFESCLTQFIQTGIGQCIVVLNPIPLRIIPTKERVTFEEILIRIQVIENPCTTTNQISALSLAEEISQILHHHAITLPNWKGWLALNEKTPWKEIQDNQNTNRYILEIHFHVCSTIIN